MLKRSSLDSIDTSRMYVGRGRNRNRRICSKWRRACDFVDYTIRAPQGMVIPKNYMYVKLIRRSDKVILSKGEWYAEGGERIGVLLPPSGWIVSGFDLYTGLPYGTSTNHDKGKKTNYSYFWRSEGRKDLVPINRECNWRAGYPFQIGITLGLSFSYNDVGVRKIMNP